MRDLEYKCISASKIPTFGFWGKTKMMLGFKRQTALKCNRIAYRKWFVFEEGSSRRWTYLQVRE
jgi:hypothetical protein